jgi:hypothetical protein
MPFGKFQIVTPEAEAEDLADVAEPPAAESSAAEWFIAVDDQAQGPYTLPEIQLHYAQALIAPDTLVFREGLSGWTRAQDVPELELRRQRSSSVPPLPPSQPPRVQRASTAALEGEVPMGRDPFAESGPPYSPRVGAADLIAPGPQRDGTVQFSLDDIRALSAVTAPSVVPTAPVKPGYAGGDGSGLIDVRSLSESAPAADAFRAVGSDLQASPLDTMAPLALPARTQRGGIDFRTKVLAGVASFGFLLMAAVAVLAMTRSPAPQAAVVPVAAEALPAAAAAAVAPGTPRIAAAVAAEPETVVPEERSAPSARAEDDDETAAAEADGEDEAAAIEREERSARPRKRGTRIAAKTAAPASERASADKPARGKTDIDDLLAAKAPAKEQPAAAKTPSKGGDDIDALLLGAIDDKKAAAKPAPAAAPAESSLQKTPSRDEVKSVMAKAKAKMGKCKGTGVAMANITVAGSGRVSNVSVSGVDGSAKSCVESAVRSTSFPKFQQPTFTLKYPFKLGG